MNRIISISFSILFLTVSQSAQAVERSSASPEILSLEGSLSLAYEGNPRLLEAREELEAQKGRHIRAEALPNPEIEFGISGLKKSRESEESEEEKRNPRLGSYSITQPLDPLGTRFLRGRIASDEIGIAESTIDLIWGEVRQEVISLYSTIQAQDKALRIAKENLDTTRQFFTSVDSRFQSGNALKSDLLRARIEVSRKENDYILREKELKLSNGRFNLSLGRPYDYPFELADGLEAVALEAHYEELLKKALKDRADLRIEEKRLSIEKKSHLSSVLRFIFPSMAVTYERTTEDFENDSAILLGASYPLWDLNFGEMKETKAAAEKQKKHLEALKRQVGLEVYEAILNAEVAYRQVILQKKALDEANELLRQVTLSYEEGKVPFIGFLENLKTINETRLSFLDAVTESKEKNAELERMVQATPIPGGAK